MNRTLLRNVFSEASLRTKNLQHIESQLNIVDKHYPNLKSRVREYCYQKNVDKKCLNKIVNILFQYARAETHNPSLRTNLEEFSKVVSQIAQHLGLMVEGISNAVVDHLSELKTRSKHLKNDLKTAASAGEAERIRSRQLDKMQSLRDVQQDRISVAEAELLKAKSENEKARKAVEQHADLFEQRKLAGVRQTLMMWTTLELRYHARALELFTHAYQAAAQIDVNSDLEEFRSKFRESQPISKTPGRLETVEETIRTQLLNPQMATLMKSNICGNGDSIQNNGSWMAHLP